MSLKSLGMREGERETTPLDWLFQEEDTRSGLKKPGHKGQRARAPSGPLVSKHVLSFKLDSVICIFEVIL